MLLHHRGIPSQCYGFATPSAVATAAAAEAEGYITSVIMRDDVIPRASPIRLRDLVIRIHQLPWAEMAEGDWIEECLKRDMGETIGGALVDYARSAMRKVAEENAREKVKEAKIEPIAPPGMLIHIYDLEWTDDGSIPEDKEEQMKRKYATAVITGDSPLLRHDRRQRPMLHRLHRTM